MESVNSCSHGDGGLKFGSKMQKLDCSFLANSDISPDFERFIFESIWRKSCFLWNDRLEADSWMV